VFSAFHILSQFDIPKGAVINGSVGKPAPKITEWTSVNDLKNLRWYFRTHQDQSIRMVDLKEAVDAAKGKIRMIPMETSTQPVANISKEVRSMKQASNQRRFGFRDFAAPGASPGPFLVAAPPFEAREVCHLETKTAGFAAT
jgi:hypothetical protein